MKTIDVNHRIASLEKDIKKTFDLIWTLNHKIDNFIEATNFRFKKIQSVSNKNLNLFESEASE